MNTYTIPIRFKQEDKLMLQQIASQNGVTLSAYIRNKVLDLPNKPTKTQKLVNLVKSLNITDEEIDGAFEAGREMRKNFRATPTK